MIDSILLLVCGVCMAALAWGFWAWLGDSALDVLMLTSLIVLAWDNRSLRKRLQTLQGAHPGRAPESER